MISSLKKLFKKRVKIVAVAAFAIAVLVGAIIQNYAGDPFTIENIVIEESTDSDTPTAEPQVIDEKININTADAELLCTLDGIGEVTAQRIIEYREENGEFGVIEDLMNISGIGEKKFAKIRDAICVK